MDDRMYWLWLSNIKGLSRSLAFQLLSIYENPRDIYQNRADLSEIIDNDELLNRICKDISLNQFENYNRLINDKNIRIITYIDDDYPIYYKKISDPPIVLYLQGELPKDNLKRIAIIGARDATSYGTEMAAYFSKSLSKMGFGIVSGLARGIDGIAHRNALLSNGYTLGVSGCGIDICYPKSNQYLYQNIIENGGGIISEHGIGVPPLKYNFPERNRLISGISDGILVIEAREKSGTLITVDSGLEDGKEIYALPGRLSDPLSIGCNQLIRQGAKIVLSPDDILEDFSLLNTTDKCDFNIDTYKKEKENFLAYPEKIVYSLLRLEPAHVDFIINKSGLDRKEVLSALFSLEKSGHIIQITNYYYSIRL